MEWIEPYNVFIKANQTLEPVRHRLWPLLWQAAAVDHAAVNLLRGFFISESRPHYRNLPEGYATVENIYADPALLAEPAAFFREHATPYPVQVQRLSRLTDGQRLAIKFPSSYETYYRAYQPEYAQFAENHWVYARVWRHFGPPRPTVVCIHGWGGGTLWLEEQVFAASQLYAAGLNVAMVTLPFHGARRPPNHFDLNLFPSSDLRRTNEAFGQAVADVQGLMQWLRMTEASSRIGILGMSLGGYVAALVASVDRTIDYVVPVITPVSLADLLWELPFDRSGKAAAMAAGFGLEQFRRATAVHCPLLHTLKVPRERVLIVAGRADRVVPVQHVMALWEHWGKPRLHWFPGGHYVQFGRRGYLQALCNLAGGTQAWGNAGSNMLLTWLQRCGALSFSPTTR